MNKVKVILDVFSDNSLTDHLKQLDGIFNVEVNYGKEEFIIEYNDDINLTRILEEVKSFCKLDYTAFVGHFEKFVDEECVELNFVVDDLCCEYCYMSTNYELIQNDAIVSISSDFGDDELGYESFFNANIVVKIVKSKYTKELEEEIKKAFE